MLIGLVCWLILVTCGLQVFIACGLGESKNQACDPFRKPKPGMWRLMEEHLNSGIAIDMEQLVLFLVILLNSNIMI